MSATAPEPLGLYVHFPWCIAKCPYCDFNSHPLRGSLDEAQYRTVLLADLEHSLALHDRRSAAPERAIGSVFFGGGTPSLFSPGTFGALIDRLGSRLAPDAEITMEANPGATEYHELKGYWQAGINRISLGAQTFDDAALKRLGRVHDAAETVRAFERARSGGFDRVNLDLMYGLPQQDPDGALADLEHALELSPDHLSWYQLTLEPRTEFYARPPQLPSDGAVATMEAEGRARLSAAGFARYEISAYAQPGEASRHNLTYWTFGDYLGIGAGAHGKWRRADGTSERTRKPSSPRLYQQNPLALEHQPIEAPALPAEFAMNTLRLVDGVPAQRFQESTGAALAALEVPWRRLQTLGLMRRERFATTERGYELLDSVVAEFL